MRSKDALERYSDTYNFGKVKGNSTSTRDIRHHKKVVFYSRKLQRWIWTIQSIFMQHPYYWNGRRL